MNHSGRSHLLIRLNAYGSTIPCLGMVWADTDDPVSQIKITEISWVPCCARSFFAQTLSVYPYLGLHLLRSMSPCHHAGTLAHQVSQKGVAGARASDGQ